MIVNNNAVLRISDSGFAPSMIGGHSGNTGFFDGATIGGGGSGLGPNHVFGLLGTVGGGAANQAGAHAVVAGGGNNSASGSTSAVGGGRNNVASVRTPPSPAARAIRPPR